MTYQTSKIVENMTTLNALGVFTFNQPARMHIQEFIE